MGILTSTGAAAALWEVKDIPFRLFSAPALCLGVFVLTVAGYQWFMPDKWKKDDWK